MELGYDARYIHWQARKAAFVDRSIVPTPLHALLALLDQEQEALTALVKACGADTAVLRGQAELSARKHPANMRDPHNERARFEALFTEGAVRAAKASGAERVGSEHLLLALAGPEGGRAAAILHNCGLTSEALAGALRPSEPEVEAKRHASWRERLVHDGFNEALSPNSSRRQEMILPQRVGLLAEELFAAGDLVLLGQLYETLGSINLLYYRPMPYLGRTLGVMPEQQLVIGAHFYRQAGEHARAALVARRAALELEERLAEPVDPEAEGIYLVAYDRELLADAAICWDPEEGRQRLEAARIEFSQIPEIDQWGEGAEDFGWGGFHMLQAQYFLPGDCRLHRDDGVKRITLKLRTWLG